MNNHDRNTTAVLDRAETYPGEPMLGTPDQLDEHQGRAGERLKESLSNIGVNIGGVRDSVMDKTKDYWRTTNGFVGRNPWVAVGISAGFAFLVGMFIGRRQQ